MTVKGEKEKKNEQLVCAETNFHAMLKPRVKGFQRKTVREVGNLQSKGEDSEKVHMTVRKAPAPKTLTGQMTD